MTKHKDLEPNKQEDSAEVQMEASIEIEAHAADIEDDFWLEIGQSFLKESPEKLEDAAKQLITLSTFAQTVYFAATRFVDLRKELSLIPSSQRWVVVTVLVMPLLF
jgi:hypothetical protein